MKIKKNPAARKNPKYTRDFPEGTLLVAELKLPGNSLTPFETLSRIRGKNKQKKEFKVDEDKKKPDA